MAGDPRLIAIGDLHGELAKFEEILRLENLVDSSNRWMGGETILIQLGDVIDRGPFSIETYRLLQRLQVEAEKSGGRVVRLFGNHELLILQEVYYYCNFEAPVVFAEEIKNEILSGRIQAAFTHGKRLYLHAGLRLVILDKLRLELGLEIDEIPQHYEMITDYINQTVRKCVEENRFDHPLFWIDASRGGRDAVGGIFWSHYRDFEREVVNPLRQVVGHSPLFDRRKEGVRWTQDGNKINVDCGLFRGYGGNQAWLVVEGDRVIAKNLWKDEVVETVIE